MKSFVSAFVLAAGLMTVCAQTTTWEFKKDSSIPEVESSAVLNLKDAITLEAWVKPDQLPSGGARIIDKSIVGTSDGYLLDTCPGNSLRMITADSTLTFDAKLPAGEWSHVAGVFSASKGIFKLYVNGKEVADAGRAGMKPLTRTGVPLRFGADSNGGNRFRGEMLRASVYEQVLSSEDILALATASNKMDFHKEGCIGTWVFAADSKKGLFANKVAGGPAIESNIPIVLAGEAKPPENPALTLWYRQPAEDWNHALPIGNGRLGAMVFGGVSHEIMQLNEDTLWTGMPHNYNKKDAYKYLPEIQKLLFEGKSKEATKLSNREFMSDPLYQMAYQPLCDLLLSFPTHTDVKNYRRELDIENGIVRVRYEVDNVLYTREVFSSFPDQVMVVRVSSSKPGALNMNAGLKCPHSSEIMFEGKDRLVIKGHWEGNGMVRGVQTDLKGKGLSFETCLKAQVEDGQLFQEKERLQIQNATSVTFLFAAATSYVNYHDISANPGSRWRPQLAAAEKKTYGALLAAHTADHAGFMDRMELTLEPGDVAKLKETQGDKMPASFIAPEKAMQFPTDERIEAIRKSKGAHSDPNLIALYTQFGRYLMLASSRPGTQPANLQGIWNKDLQPAWGSKYTININIEMNYWPTEVGNLAECHDPLFSMLDDLRVTGADTAKQYYNARGFVAHHNTDLWRGAAAVDGVWGVWPMSAAWMARHPYEHYLYSQDEEFLRNRAWPIMKDAAMFILDFLVPAPEGSPVAGKLVTNPSHSPENSFVRADGTRSQFTYAATMDLMIIHDLFVNCLDAVKVLDDGSGTFEKEFVSQIQTALANLAPLQISPRDGRLQEWVEDYKDAEPGHRHMSHFFGLHPGHQITLRGTPKLATALRKSLDTRLANGGGGTGWSRAWIVNFAARFEDAALAWNNIQLLIARCTLPNMFDNHPPFQIDGNFGGCAGVMEMLLQSHADNEINLLPALPIAWGSGSVAGLRARGGFEVNLCWADGKLTEVTILSKAGKKCNLRYGEKVISFDTKPNCTYVFDETLTAKK